MSINYAYKPRYLIQKRVGDSDWTTMKEFTEEAPCTKMFQKAKQLLKDSGKEW